MNLYALYSDPDQLYLYNKMSGIGTDIFELRSEDISAFAKARNSEDLKEIELNWKDAGGSELWFSEAINIAAEIMPHLREPGLQLLINDNRWSLEKAAYWIIKFTKKRNFELEKRLVWISGNSGDIDDATAEYLKFFNITKEELAK